MNRRTLMLVGLLLSGVGKARELAPGLDYEVLPGKFSGGPVYALKVDLQRYRVVQTDPTRPLQRTAAGFASTVGALAVTNSNFYVNAATGPPVGLLAGAGNVAKDSVLWYQPPTFLASVGVRRGDGFAAPFSSQGLLHGPLPSCFTDVFTGSEWALRQGVVPATTTSTDQGLVARHPRTVLGLSQDRRYLFLFVAQGRNVPTGALGYSVVGASSIGYVARDFGAFDAINLDGGGSSKMWVRALGGIQNSPTDGTERLVAYHLGVVLAPDAGSTPCGTLDAGSTDAGETGAAQTDAGETGAAQTDAGETGAAQTDAGETGAAQTDAGETDAGVELEANGLGHEPLAPIAGCSCGAARALGSPWVWLGGLLWAGLVARRRP